MATLPNNILRAGPWGNLTSAHEDVPADVSVPLGIYPVNCALNDWPNQVWAAYYSAYNEIQDDTDTEYGLAGLGHEVSKTSDSSLFYFTPGVSFVFCYQATDPFDIDFNWGFIGAGFEYNFPDLSWSYETINGDSDSFFTTPTNSGTETISLPAATFGLVSAYVSGYLLDFDKVLTVTASLTNPQP